MLTRRQFLKTLGLGSIAGVGALTWQTLPYANQIDLVETEIQIANLPSAFNHYKIAFLSDLHLGVYVPDEWIDQAITLAVKAEADLLLLGGDYIWLQDYALARFVSTYRNPKYQQIPSKLLAKAIFDQAAKILTQAQFKDGIFAVYGNHDHWIDPLQCKESFFQNRANFLINDLVQIKRGEQTLNLVGVDDYWTGSPKIPPLPERNKNNFRLLLSHNPDFVSLISSAKNLSFDFDLALCGHTHGGQICLPFLGPIVQNIVDQRFLAGKYRFESQGAFSRNVYTTRGIGMVEIPYRLNCNSEVSILRLKAI